jgi:trimeric autotransporter adhesin
MRSKTSTRVAIEDQYMQKSFIPILGTLLTIGAILAAGLPGISRADITYTVNSTLDQLDDDLLDGICHTAANTCTLRAAVMSASRASGAGATIVLPPGVYGLTRPVTGLNDEENGDLDFLSPSTGNPTIFLMGSGMDTTIIDANQIDRAVEVHSDRAVVISRVTIRNGLRDDAQGGGIFSTIGTLTIIADSRVEGSRAFVGGGIFSSGTLTALRCEFVGNQAVEKGGALYYTQLDSQTPLLLLSQSRLRGNHARIGGGIFAAHTTRIIESEISQNTAEVAGGVYAMSSVTLINSTVAYNDADSNGGGLYVEAGKLVNIYNSTIVGNGADNDQDFNGAGGGVYMQSSLALLELYNTIIAGNYVSNTPQPDDCRGIVRTHARNLFGSTSGCVIDQISGSWDFLNSLGFLGPLQNNGGPTQTIALLAGSNAINAGTPGAGCLDNTSTTIVTDQRGFPRNVGICDLGAYEYGATDPDVIFRSGFD